MKSETDRNVRILIVDHNQGCHSPLADYFADAGYQVSETSDSAQLTDQAIHGQIDLVLLNDSLATEQALRLTHQLRARLDVGIILISAKDDEIDRIVGLEMGADDFISGPCNPRELLARVRNLLWRIKTPARTDQPTGSSVCRFEGWQLDARRRLLTDPENSSRRLPEGEFRLLQALISRPGQVMSRDQLMDAVRDRQWSPSDRSVDVLVGRVRRKLRDDSTNPRFILTAHGAGYLFAGELA